MSRPPSGGQWATSSFHPRSVSVAWRWAPDKYPGAVQVFDRIGLEANGIAFTLVPGWLLVWSLICGRFGADGALNVPVPVPDIDVLGEWTEETADAVAAKAASLSMHMSPCVDASGGSDVCGERVDGGTNGRCTGVPGAALNGFSAEWPRLPGAPKLEGDHIRGSPRVSVALGQLPTRFSREGSSTGDGSSQDISLGEPGGTEPTLIALSAR